MRKFLAILLLLVLPGLAYADCTPPSEGLIHHWKLDESSGAAVDSAGSMNGTVNVNTTQHASGGELDGYVSMVNSSITIGEPTDVQGLSQMTLTAWMKRTAANDGVSIGSETVSNSSYGISLFNDGKFYAQVYNGSDAYQTVDSNDTAWHHVALVFDGTQSGNARVQGYLDGQPLVGGYTGTPPATVPNPSDDFEIGSMAAETSAGSIDDVRIYNRALSANEVAALYATRSTADAKAGFMYYDEEHARLAYCNGTSWVHAGIGPYNPSAVRFSSGGNYLSAGLTGLTGSKTWSGSVWFRMNAVPTSDVSILDSSNNPDISVGLTASGAFIVYGKSAANENTLDIESSPITDTNWHHAMWSVDMSDAGKRHLYIDDQEDIAVVNHYFDHALGFASASAYYVGREDDGSYKLDGELADMWMDFGSYIDLADKSNRRKFISTTGLPMYLGPDGSIPTGSKPAIFLTGDAVSFSSNQGSAGGFTEHGALLPADSQPGDSVLAEDLTGNLLGHWALDESGNVSTAADRTGSNDGTLTNFPADPSANWVSGKIAGALDFDGVDDYVKVPDASTFDLTAGFSLTVAAWVKTAPSYDCGTNGDNKIAVGYRVGTPQWWLGCNQSTDAVRWSLRGSGGNTKEIVGTSVINDGQWHEIVGRYDGDADLTEIYVDGQREAQASLSLTGGLSGTAAVCLGGYGSNCTGFANAYWNGQIDDVRIYDRALSRREIATLATLKAGVMVYNPDFHVMQYFNGAEWVAMGPVGGEAPASGLVGWWKLDEASSPSVDSSANSNDGTWVNSPTYAASGQIDGALTLNGTDQYVDAGNDSSLQITGSMTVSAWVNASSFGSSGDDTIVSKTKNNATDIGWGLSGTEDNGPNQFMFFLSEDGSDTYTVDCYSATEYTTNVWYHVAATYDASTQTIEVYVNGARDTDSCDASVPSSQNDSAANALIGARDSVLSRPWTGQIDDVRVYNRALSASEVQALYAYGLGKGYTIGSGGCSGPSMPAGSIFFNVDHSVAEYCNGARWIGIGK